MTENSSLVKNVKSRKHDRRGGGKYVRVGGRGGMLRNVVYKVVVVSVLLACGSGTVRRCGLWEEMWHMWELALKVSYYTQA